MKALKTSWGLFRDIINDEYIAGVINKEQFQQFIAQR